jgi:hypothetical protein
MQPRFLKPFLFLSAHLVLGIGLSAAESETIYPSKTLFSTDILLGQDDSGQEIWGSVEKKQSSNGETHYVVDSTLQKWIGTDHLVVNGDIPLLMGSDTVVKTIDQIAHHFLKYWKYSHIPDTKGEIHTHKAFQDFLTTSGYTREILQSGLILYYKKGEHGSSIICDERDNEATFVFGHREDRWGNRKQGRLDARQFKMLTPDIQKRILELAKRKSIAYAQRPIDFEDPDPLFRDPRSEKNNAFVKGAKNKRNLFKSTPASKRKKRRFVK